MLHDMAARADVKLFVRVHLCRLICSLLFILILKWDGRLLIWWRILILTYLGTSFWKKFFPLRFSTFGGFWSILFWFLSYEAMKVKIVINIILKYLVIAWIVRFGSFTLPNFLFLLMKYWWNLRLNFFFSSLNFIIRGTNPQQIPLAFLNQ